jgi:hypothetical protein
MDVKEIKCKGADAGESPNGGAGAQEHVNEILVSIRVLKNLDILIGFFLRKKHSDP